MSATDWYYSTFDNAWHQGSWFKVVPTKPGSPTPGTTGNPTPPTAASPTTPTTTTPTVNPAVLNALTLQYGQERAELDDQQNRRRINYNSALGKLGRGVKDLQLKSRESFSDRGMLQSGPSLANQVKIRDEYNRQRGELGTAYQTDLATIARRRLESKQNYTNNKLLASLGLETQ